MGNLSVERQRASEIPLGVANEANGVPARSGGECLRGRGCWARCPVANLATEDSPNTVSLPKAMRKAAMSPSELFPTPVKVRPGSEASQGIAGLLFLPLWLVAIVVCRHVPIADEDLRALFSAGVALVPSAFIGLLHYRWARRHELRIDARRLNLLFDGAVIWSAIWTEIRFVRTGLTKTGVAFIDPNGRRLRAMLFNGARRPEIGRLWRVLHHLADRALHAERVVRSPGGVFVFAATAFTVGSLLFVLGVDQTRAALDRDIFAIDTVMLGAVAMKATGVILLYPSAFVLMMSLTRIASRLILRNPVARELRDFRKSALGAPSPVSMIRNVRYRYRFPRALAREVKGSGITLGVLLFIIAGVVLAAPPSPGESEPANALGFGLVGLAVALLGLRADRRIERRLSEEFQVDSAGRLTVFHATGSKVYEPDRLVTSELTRSGQSSVFYLADLYRAKDGSKYLLDRRYIEPVSAQARRSPVGRADEAFA